MMRARKWNEQQLGERLAMSGESTYGERMVRTAFNPSSDDLVDQIKQKTAELIDLIDANKIKDPRLAGITISAYEGAAMWAVKMATSK